MGIFRRRREETLNEQMLNEAGIDDDTQATDEPDADPDPSADAQSPADPFALTYAASDPIGIWTRAMARPGEYDAFLEVHAPEIAGDTAEFATLPEGDVIVVRAFYTWEVFTPMLSFFLSNMSGTNHLLATAAAFRNEPYTTTTGGC